MTLLAMNLNDTPIRRKVTLMIMITCTAVLFLSMLAFMSYELYTVRANLVETAQTIAQLAAAESSAAVAFEDENNCDEILSKLTAEQKILLAALYSKDGQLLARHPQTESIKVFPRRPSVPGYTIQHGRLNIFAPVQLESRNVGTLYLEWDISPAYRGLRWYGVVMILVLIGSLAVSLAISQWVQRLISVPILALASTAQEVARTGDYALKAKKYSNDELGVFTDSFNHMLRQIQAQNASLHQTEEELRRALQSAEIAGLAVRAMNSELEDRVRNRTAELAASNQELEAFAYSVSHDLRAPLRHIDGYAQILEQSLESDPASCKQYLRRIRSGVENMGQLVDDLLKLSQVGRVAPNFQTVSLDAIVEEVLNELKPEIGPREIEWRVGALPATQADRGLVKQVFTNLLDNAVKYTRPRARAVVEVGVEPVEGGSAFFVRDNGVGFNMKYAHKLFGVFQRLHRAEEFEGTGVGLATVERIVRLHGGKIWVQAELDKGTVFHFTLPGLGAALA